MNDGQILNKVYEITMVGLSNFFKIFVYQTKPITRLNYVTNESYDLGTFTFTCKINTFLYIFGIIMLSMNEIRNL